MHLINTFRGHIVLKFEPPVAHLLFPQAHVGLFLQLFFRVKFPQVNRSVVQRGRQPPRLALVVRRAQELGHQSTPADKICEDVIRPIPEAIAKECIKQTSY